MLKSGIKIPFSTQFEGSCYTYFIFYLIIGVQKLGSPEQGEYIVLFVNVIRRKIELFIELDIYVWIHI